MPGKILGTGDTTRTKQTEITAFKGLTLLGAGGGCLQP